MQRNTLALIALAGLLSLSGCAQKVTIKTLQPAQIDRAASAKQIGVLPFDSDYIGLGPKIEATLAAYQLEPGKSYFTVVGRSDLDRVIEEQKFQHSGLADDAKAAQLGQLAGAQALISGTVSTAAVNDSVHYENRSRCASSDKNGKCLKTESYPVPCRKRTATLAAQVRMVDVQKGDLITARNFNETNSWTYCYDGSADQTPSKEQGLSMLADRIASQFVRIVTPRYVSFEVELIEKLDVEVPGAQEDKFDGALSYIKEGRFDRGAQLLGDLMDETGRQSYAVAYNLGVLREAEGNYAEAKRLYVLADRLAVKPVKPINRAVSRIDGVIAKHNKALEQIGRE